MAEGIAGKPPLAPPKYVTVLNTLEPSNAWTLAAVSGGILLLYSLSRIIALQRRVRDLEARPPVDDIVMRGMIRQQVSEMVTDLEQSIRARNAFKPAPTPPAPVEKPAAKLPEFEKVVQAVAQPTPLPTFEATVTAVQPDVPATATPTPATPDAEVPKVVKRKVKKVATVDL